MINKLRNGVLDLAKRLDGPGYPFPSWALDELAGFLARLDDRLRRRRC